MTTVFSVNWQMGISRPIQSTRMMIQGNTRCKSCYKGTCTYPSKAALCKYFEIEDETLAKAAKLAKKIMTHEKDVLGCEGYNLVQNNGEVAGQTVFHFHMHLIPRYESDDNKMS